MPICRICNNTIDNKSYICCEMMLGYRDKFEYVECAKCGCLQIKEIPQNISKYYPNNYYSFQKTPKNNFLESFFRHKRAKIFLYNKNNFWRVLLSKIIKTPNYYNWIKKVEIKFESEILDVGCGWGGVLFNMASEGFYNLNGVDPFIERDIFDKSGIRILKKDLSEVTQQFDFIMLHHSLEHMPDQLTIFRELYRLLKSNRYVLIRIPVVSSFAWRKYGVNWVQIDAPRHFFLHTNKSIQILADQVGFKIVDIEFDSTAFQFWGSEQYLRDIPLRDNISYAENPKKSIFSGKEIKSFGAKAIELNKNKDGDSACFYLYKT